MFFKWLERWKLSAIVSTMVLAAVITILFQAKVADWIYKNARYENVVFEIADGEHTEIALLENNYQSAETKYYWNSTQLKEHIIDIQGFEESIEKQNNGSAEEDEEVWKLSGNTPGARITISMPVLPNSFLVFYSNESTGVAQIWEEDEGDIWELNTNSESEGYICYYPFEARDYVYVYIQYILIYVGLFLLTCLIVFIIEKIIFSEKKMAWQIGSKWWFAILFAVTMIYLVVFYTVNPENYQVSSEMDAYYYMNPPFFDENGIFSISYFVENVMQHRGYFPMVISLLCNTIASYTGVSTMYYHFVVYSLMVAFVFAVALPLLHEALTKKKVWCGSCILSYMTFMLFWRKELFYTLSDIPSALCCIGAVSLFVYGLYKQKWIWLTLAGGLIGIACAYRASYSLVANLGIVVAGVYVFWVSIIKKRWKSVVFIVAFIGGLFILLSPQYYINVKKGVSGIYPSGSYGWAYDPIQGTIQSLTENSAQAGLNSYYFMSEKGLDEQMVNLNEELYRDKTYVLEDLIYIVFSKPLDFLSIYLKKMFWVFCKNDGGTYQGSNDLEILSIFTRTINFILMGNFLLVLFKDKVVDIKSKLVTGLLLSVTLLPQLLLHIENRFFVFPYIIIQFVVLYYIPVYVQKQKAEKESIAVSNYKIYMAVYILLSYMLYLTISKNFF